MNSITTCGPFICKETLGKGGYATVKLAEHNETRQQCALKIMRRKGISDAFDKLVKNEISIMKELSHQNIINILDYSEDALYTLPDGRTMEVYYIALELAENGEMFDYIAEGGRFSEPLACYYLHQLIEALEHMNKNGIVHRDIKPENILLNSNYDIKLTDFGFAEHQTSSTVRKGTRSYMAPEMHLVTEFETLPLDIFALGVVLFIMIKGAPPFNTAKITDQHYKLFLSNPLIFWKCHFKRFEGDAPSIKLIDLLSKMMNSDPERRISLEEVKEHAFFTQELPTKEDVIEEMTSRELRMEGDQDMEE